MNSLPDTLLSDSAPKTGARADAAYDHLRTWLLEGDLNPGDKLSVVALTRRLSCSRVPVMAALKRLESDGFVRIVPQVGCHVVTPGAQEARDFFTLFAAVEGTIHAFAAARRDAEDVAAFKAVCAEVDAGAARAGGPADGDPAYRRLNLLFHGLIHRMARAPGASTIASGLWDRSDFYIKVAFGSLYFSAAVRRAHRSIRKAIIAGEDKAAYAAAHAHLDSVGARVARALSAAAARTPAP